MQLETAAQTKQPEIRPAVIKTPHPRTLFEALKMLFIHEYK